MYRVLLATLLIPLAMPLVQACSSPEDQAGDARDAALAAVAAADWTAAQVALEALHGARSETPETLAELAGLMLEAGEAPQAVWVLEDGLIRFPSSDGLRAALATAALRMGAPGRVELVLEPVSSESTAYAPGLVALAEAQLALGEAEPARATLEALADWEQSADPSSRRRLELTRLGLAALEAEGDAGLAALEAEVEKHPDDANAWSTLERELQREGRSERARDLLAAALKQQPASIGLFAPLASAHLALGDVAAAEAVLRERLELHSTPGAHIAIARLRAAQGQRDAALARYGLALAAFPQSEMLRFGHIDLLLDVGLPEEARAQLDQYRKVAPGPRAEYLLARLELAQDKPDLALRRLGQVVERLDTPSTQFWLGRALEATGDLAGAEERYLVAQRGSPTQAGPALAAARLAQQRGDWRAVVRATRPVVERSPHEEEGWELLADALAQLNAWDEAETLARQRAERFPLELAPSLRLAEALRSQQRVDEAVAVLEQAATRARETDPEARRKKARQRRQKRQRKKGQSQAERKQEQEADEAQAGVGEEPPGEPPEILAERGLALGVAGKASEGLALCDEGLAHSPRHARLQAVRALLLFGLGREREAVRGTDIAIDLDPEDLRPLRARAEYYGATQQFESARRDCETYLIDRPDDSKVLFILGMADESTGRTDAAIEAYARSAEFDSQAWASRNNLAMLLAKRGDFTPAVAAAEQAHQLSPENPFVLDTLGFVYLRSGQPELALPPLEKAAQILPDAVEVQLHRAEAYAAAGRPQDARRVLSGVRARAGSSSELVARVDALLAELP